MDRLVVDLKQYGELHIVRAVRDLIRRWWGLELAFADDRGYVLEHAEGKIIPSDNEFCRQALFSKEGFRRCNDSIKVVRDRLRGVKKRNVIVHECHLGFDVVAAALWVGGSVPGPIRLLTCRDRTPEGQEGRAWSCPRATSSG